MLTRILLYSSSKMIMGSLYRTSLSLNQSTDFYVKQVEATLPRSTYYWDRMRPLAFYDGGYVCVCEWGSVCVRCLLRSSFGTQALSFSRARALLSSFLSRCDKVDYSWEPISLVGSVRWIAMADSAYFTLSQFPSDSSQDALVSIPAFLRLTHGTIQSVNDIPMKQMMLQVP